MNSFNKYVLSTFPEYVKVLIEDMKLPGLKITDVVGSVPMTFNESIDKGKPYEALIIIKYKVSNTDHKATLTIPLMSDEGIFFNGTSYQSGTLSMQRKGIAEWTNKNYVFRLNPSTLINYNTKVVKLDNVDIPFDAIDDMVPPIVLGDDVMDQLKYKSESFFRFEDNLLTLDMIGEITSIPFGRTDNLTDYGFSDLTTSIKSYLSSYAVAKDFIRHNKSQFSRSEKLNMKMLQVAVRKFFLSKVKRFKSTLQYIQLLNPLNMVTLKSKVTIPPYFLLNKTFFDAIDPINTPENGNVNKLNELNRCISFHEGITYIKVFDKSFNELEIPLSKSKISRVVISKSVDYLNKTVLKPTMITFRDQVSESSDYDYIQMPPDYRLSEATSLIPMINSSEGPRLAMGAGMMKQAVELDSTEYPLISSGNTVVSPTSVNSLVKGTVKSIDTDKIILTTENGDIKVPARKDLSSMSNMTITYSPQVKVGDQVDVGTELIRTSITPMDMGLNLKVAFTTYKFLDHEDSIIISESCAEKLRIIQTMTHKFKVAPDSTIVNIVKVGDLVDYNTSLLDVRTTVQFKTSIKKLKNELLKDKPNTKLVQHKVGDSVISGIVTSVKYSVAPDMDTPAILSTMVEDMDSVRSSVSEKYLKTHPTPKQPGSGIVIEVVVHALNTAGSGNKLTNRYGSKGIISKVLPDHLMPRVLVDDDSISRDIIQDIFTIAGSDKSGQVREEIVDVIMNPDATYSRKNYSQLNEASLSVVSSHLYSKYLTRDSTEEFIDTYSKYNPSIPKDPYALDALVHTKGIGAFGFVTGSVSSYNTITIQSMLKELGISDRFPLYYPEYGTVTEPVQVGFQYMFRLKQLPEESMKLTSSINTGAPLLGLGKTRRGGQSVNEMETVILIAAGVDDLTKELKEDNGKRRRRLGMHLLLAGAELID